MKTAVSTRIATLMVLCVGSSTACSGTSTEPTSPDPAALLSVVPTGGAMDVAVGTNVVITFNHAIPEEMKDYVDLHEAAITGPEVVGTWSLSADHMALTFAPASALKPATTYVIHIGGDMMDEDGDQVDLEMHGLGMGGQWATASMMTGGMMGGMSGGHMGSGWLDPDNGTYGMIFQFTTAG